MRTEKIGEDQGKITSMKVLEAEPYCIKCELNFQEKGNIMGIEFESFGTYKSISGSYDVENGEAKGFMTTKNGEIITYSAFGIGNSTGKGFEGKYKIVLQFKTESSSEELKRLCKAPVLAEYECDEDGKSRTTYYEWNI